MKTLIITTAVIFANLAFSEATYAQRKDEAQISANEFPYYKTAIGLRGGGTSGATLKHFTSQRTAVEGILGIWYNAFSVTGLIERYVPAGISSIPGLQWYYGGGGHIAFETGRTYYVYEGTRYAYRYSEGEVGFGLDGILGIEYKIPPIPFAISLDMKPFVEINTFGSAFISLDPGVGIKFTF